MLHSHRNIENYFLTHPTTVYHFHSHFVLFSFEFLKILLGILKIVDTKLYDTKLQSDKNIIHYIVSRNDIVVIECRWLV